MTFSYSYIHTYLKTKRKWLHNQSLLSKKNSPNLVQVKPTFSTIDSGDDFQYLCIYSPNMQDWSTFFCPILSHFKLYPLRGQVCFGTYSESKIFANSLVSDSDSQSSVSVRNVFTHFLSFLLSFLEGSKAIKLEMFI